MKAPDFDYVRATTVAEAVAALARHEGEAKIVAGGQSLTPMLNFRLLAPAALVDINGIRELDFIEPTDEGDNSSGLRIGALTRHRTALTSDLVRARFPVISEALRHTAHLAIRNRGTIGGSLSHADPAAEWPMLAVLLDAELTVVGPGGERRLAAAELFDGALMTTLAEDELLTVVTFPGLPAGAAWGFEEFAMRRGDFALAAAAVTLTFEKGAAGNVRLAVLGVDETPLRVPAAEAALDGSALDTAAIDAAAEAVRRAVNPNDDVHTSADYRRRLVGGLVKRVVEQARARATGEEPV